MTVSKVQLKYDKKYITPKPSQAIFLIGAMELERREGLELPSSQSSENFETPIAVGENHDLRTINQATKEKQPQLETSLCLLFCMRGISLQLPSLALLAIVNDRVAIPPAYLSAYGAVAFLPASLKPFYAAMSRKQRHLLKNGDPKGFTNLLAILLAVNGLAYMGTAWLIPVGGVVSCFIWGFIRGMASSWPEFLLDQKLINQAQRQNQHMRDTSPPRSEDTLMPPNNDSSSYQALSALFQSQAATCRNLGSLIASLGTFAIFVSRIGHHYEAQQRPGKEDGIYRVLLLITAGINLAASIFVAMSTRDYSYVEIIDTELSSAATNADSEIQFAIHHEQQLNESTSSSVHQNYQDQFNHGCPSTSAGIPPEERDNRREVFFDEDAEEPPQRSTNEFQHYGDIALLLLLQTLLIWAAMKRPIESLGRSQGTVVWRSLACTLGLTFVIVAFVTYHRNKRDIGRADYRDSIEKKFLHLRRLGLYLILHHSVPIAGSVMYSYIYSVFSGEPVFLQGLMIIGSAVSVFANCFYSHFLAQKYHSGYKMIYLILVLTIIASLVSLLDVEVVHMANDSATSAAQLRWTVVIVKIVTYFIGYVGFMPSVVLATANVLGSEDLDSNDISTRRDNTTSTTSSSSRDQNGSKKETSEEPTIYNDDGMQYSTLVSCIDFGAQVGDWISVPIIAALGITRENNWTNLDQYIIICAAARLFSVSFLWLIRPESGDEGHQRSNE